MYKPLADSTLQRMKKNELIELLRIAEHNAKIAQEYVDKQAENIKDWKPVVCCSQCKHHRDLDVHFCMRHGIECPDDAEFFCKYGEKGEAKY